MRVVGWLALAMVALVARPAPATACTCDRQEPTELEPANLAGYELLFDGWVLRRPVLPGACPLPPAPPAKRGCVRIRVHRHPDCTPMTFPNARLEPIDGSGDEAYRALTTSKDGVTELCGLKKGRYVLTATSDRWITDPDGTLENGILVDIDPAIPQSYSGVAVPSSGWVVVPVVVHKGTVAAQEIMISPSVCPSRLAPFTAYRFSGRRQPDGKIELPGCGVRQLSDDEIQAMVKPRAPAAPPSPPPAAPCWPARLCSLGARATR